MESNKENTPVSNDNETPGDGGTSETNEAEDPGLSPENFDKFLPWACNQLHVDVNVVIISVKKYLARRKALYSEKQSLTKRKIIHRMPSKVESIVVEKEKEDSTCVTVKKSIVFDFDDENIRIHTIYDIHNNLVELKFDKNKRIPRGVLQIIRLTLPYHVLLTRIVMNRGVTNNVIYEIKNWLSLSCITEIVLDNSDIKNGYFEILIEHESSLTNLSLARCNIDDDILKKIATNLTHPLPGSKMLYLLNLTSNKITDTGAKYLAEALKTNRRLVYLNLADNSISDIGFAAILEVLSEFRVTWEQTKAYMGRYTKYWRDKQKTMLEKSDITPDVIKSKKSLKHTPTNPSAKKQKDKDIMFKISDDDDDEFDDPFSKRHVYARDNVLYCYGNNYLAYLNITYNNISYFSVKKLLAVLLYQKMMERKPKGLVNVSIEGNNIPASCGELKDIDDLLRVEDVISKRMSVTKKKIVSASSGPPTTRTSRNKL